MTAKEKIIYISLGTLLIPVVVCAYLLVVSNPPVNDYRIMFEGVLPGGWVVLEIAILMLISLYYSFAGAPPSPSAEHPAQLKTMILLTPSAKGKLPVITTWQQVLSY